MFLVTNCTIKSLFTPCVAILVYEFSDPFDTTVGSRHKHKHARIEPPIVPLFVPTLITQSVNLFMHARLSYPFVSLSLELHSSAVKSRSRAEEPDLPRLSLRSPGFADMSVWNTKRYAENQYQLWSREG